MPRELEMSDGGIRKDTLSNRMLRAALLVSEDRLTDEQIAEQAGVKRNALAKWKRREDFTAEVERIRTAARDQVMHEGIALKVNRMRRLDKHAQEIEAKKEKVEDNKEFAALSKQYLATLEQAAREMGGQFEEKPNDPGGTLTDNRKVIFNFPVASPELLAEVANAPYADLPAARPRLLTRPSDGKPIG